MINSAMHDDKIGNYFDPEGVIDINWNQWILSLVLNLIFFM
jgi:hypothetical protein